MLVTHKNTKKVTHKSQNIHADEVPSHRPCRSKKLSHKIEQNLYKRGNIFYYRRRFFRQLSEALQQNELRISLKTVFLDKAKHFKTIIDKRYELLEVKTKGKALTKERLAEIFKAWIDHTLKELDEDLTELPAQFDYSLIKRTKNWVTKNQELLKDAIARNMYTTSYQDTEYLKGIKTNIASRQRHLNVTVNLKEIEEIVAKYGKERLESSSNQIAIREFMKATQYVYKIFLERLDGNYTNDYDINFFKQPRAIRKERISPSLRISTAIDEFVALNSGYEKEIIAHLKYFEQYFITLDKITRSGLDEFKNKIITKYPNTNKNKKYLTVSVQDLMKLDVPESEIISLNSKNTKIIMRINSFLKWLYQDKGYLSELLQIRRFKTNEFEDARAKRLPYDKVDLARLFTQHPWYTTEFEKLLKTNYHKVLIPLVTLYTGMRLQEVCQLDANDIITEDGIMCFNVSNDYENDGEEFEDNAYKKRLKNIHSKRKIPIHKMLIDLKVIDFLQMQSKSGKLWKTLKPSNSTTDAGRYKDTWGSQFRSISKDFIDSKSYSKKTFYSFRHTFSNALKQTQCQTSILEEVTGHSTKGIATSIYSERYEMKVINPYIQAINFEINLSHIKKLISRSMRHKQNTKNDATTNNRTKAN